MANRPINKAGDKPSTEHPSWLDGLPSLDDGWGPHTPDPSMDGVPPAPDLQDDALTGHAGVSDIHHKRHGVFTHPGRWKRH